MCARVSASYTVCIFCAILFCGHTSELGAAIIRGKSFCFPPLFFTNWRTHIALIDAKGRGKATAAPQHLCTGKRTLAQSLSWIFGLFERCAKLWGPLGCPFFSVTALGALGTESVGSEERDRCRRCYLPALTMSLAADTWETC